MALVGAVVVLAMLAFAPSALASFVTPGPNVSPNASRISDLYTITLVIATIIFVGVEGTLLYALVRFRKRKGRVAVQIHGNTRLEVGWTIGAATILVALAIVTFAELQSIRDPSASGSNGLTVAQGAQLTSDDAIKPPRGPYMTIQVNGQQYIWRFTYLHFGKLADQLDDPYTYYHLYVPTNTTVVLKVVSQDVVHSWWIPALGPKVQAVPGYTNWTWFKISKPGSYSGQCAFICGRGHATMRAVVTALPPKQWVAWLHKLEAGLKQNKQGGAAGRGVLNKRSGSAAVENP
ncbi:MAG TPA: cytochrome c oxidase subunit II [Solirubrobacteraceae bacterium]|nr:cytochrome c oxidase subunit II [Solirubrobacteraceae bacterium]